MIWLLKLVPAVPVVTLMPDTTGGGITVIDTDCGAPVPPALLPVTLKVDVPLPDGVPEITPVDVFKVKPAGNDPDDSA